MKNLRNVMRSRATAFVSLRVVLILCAVTAFTAFGVASARNGGFDWFSIRKASAESKGAKATARASAQRVLSPQIVFFSEGFDGAWTIPSTLLTNASPWSGPFDGTDTDTEWHRNDFQGGWTGAVTSGTYSPSGSPGFSARFHTFLATAPKVGDLITPVIDLSVNAGSKVLTFNYINPSGTDKVDVAVSTDGGTIYGAPVLTTGVSTVWSQQTINLGPVVSSTVTIRFRATSDFGSDDIGIDNVVIGLASAPLVGTKTIKTAGGDYSTFSAAINDLNVSGVGAGGVTFNVDAGLTSTEDPPCITAQGTVTDQIIFQKSGAGSNPVVRPTGAGGTADFGLCISGGDFITFDGIDVSIATGSAVEYGYLVRNISATNGAKNNTIKNTSVTLNRANTASIGILQTTAATGGGIAATSLTGSNSTNKYYNLTMQNVYAGIYLLGTAAFPDDACEVGVTGAVTKNSIGSATANDIGNGTVATWGIRAASESNAKIFNNEIRNITSTSSTTTGIHMDNAGTVTAVSLGTTQIYNNQIHDLNGTTSAAVGIVYGIRANLTGNAGSVARIQNNFIHTLNSSSTSTTSVRLVGINVQDAGTGTGATFNVHNNSVRIAQPTLTTINSCFVIGGAAATNPVYNVRNNIFANVTGAQAGAAKHYTWVSTSNTSIGLAAGTVSDFNDLYVTGTNGFVGRGSTIDYATITDWRGMDPGVGPDDTSISSDPLFVSATDLHLIGTSPAINVATTIATVTDDIDAQSRPQGAAYDIGGDEFVPAPGILQLSSATYGGTEGGSANATVNRVSGSSGTVGVTYTLTDGTAVGGAACTAGVDYINPGPQLLSFGDTVTSQPIAVTLCSDGAVVDPLENFTITLSLPTGGATLGSPTNATVTIQDLPPPFSGSYNVGTAQTYTSLTNPGGIFEAINLVGATGNVAINITSDLTGETGAVALNLVAGGFTVTIQPSGAPRSITGSISSTALIRTNGANGVTIDGSVGGGGVDRSLTIENTNVTNPSVILFGSIGATPITNDTLKNCVVRNGATTSTAVVISDAGVLGNAGFFSNITVQNNDIQKAFIGVFATGGTTPQNGSNLTYTQNTLNSAGANAIRLAGLYMQGVNGATVSDNVIANFEAVNTENDTGIWLASGTINATVSGNTISALNYTGAGGASPIGINVTSGLAASNDVVRGNSISNMTSGGASSASPVMGISAGVAPTGGVTIERNNVQNIGNTNPATWPAVGINLNGGNANIVRNNFVARVYNDQTAGTGGFNPTFGASGIRLNLGTGHQVYNNSVHMYGAMAGVVSSDLLSALAISATTVTDCDIRNNILSNEMTGGNPAGGNTRFVAINLPPSPTVSMNLTLNNNAYFEGTDPNCRMAVVGQTVAAGDFAAANFNAGSTSPATNFRSVSSTLSAAGTNDNASFASTAAPAFVSASDLHITPSAGAVLGGATPIGSVTIDYDNDPRPAANPDMGADELVQATGGSFAAGTYYNASAAGGDSLGGNVTITNTLNLGGILSTGANTLTIGCNASVTGASATNYVNGNLKKNYCNAGVKGFEVGTANGYSPVSVNVTAGTFPADFTVKAVQGPQPNIANPGSALQRYWTLTATGVTADLNFNYLDLDIPAPPTSENSFVIFKYNGSFTMPGGTVSPGTNEASITGVTSFSDWTLAQPNAPTVGSSRISGVVTRSDGQPLGGVTVNLGGTQAARTITNSNGFYLFSNVDTNGFYTVTPGLANYSFSPASRSFSLVGDRTDAAFTGTSNSTATENPVNVGDFFVRQQYLDFLGREPDQQGWLFWTAQLSQCGLDANCVRQKRIDISAAFFMSDEFQQGGNYVYRLYRAALGRRLTYAEFSEDRQQVIGGPGLDASRIAFADSFVERPEFMQKYQNISSGELFVDALLRTVQQDAGLELSSQREALIQTYNSGADLNHSRSAVLRAVAESGAFKDAVYNASFVLTEYFGYLQRSPDADGYAFWLNVLNESGRNGAPGDYRGMVCSFLTSAEYQRRFSPVVTHSNNECGQ